MKRPFPKAATTHAQQIARLQQRGMIIDDSADAEFYLRHLNIYNTTPMVMLLYAMDLIAPHRYWRARLNTLLSRHAIDVAEMDFPTGWEQMPIWQEEVR